MKMENGFGGFSSHFSNIKEEDEDKSFSSNFTYLDQNKWKDFMKLLENMMFQEEFFRIKRCKQNL